MEDAENDMPGRTRVRELLIKPLEARGLKRKRGAKADDHAKAVERLVERLAYMTPGGLRALAEVVERLADGPLRNEWPAELTVVRFADGIEKAPPPSDRLLTSYMRSAAGRAAWAESPFLASELARYLVKLRRPPMDSAWPAMRGRAAERAREIGAAERREADGRDGEGDRQDLAAWRVAKARVQALVFDGQEAKDEAA